MISTSLIFFVLSITYYEYRSSKKILQQETQYLSKRINSAFNDYTDRVDGIISVIYYELETNPAGALANFLNQYTDSSAMEEKINSKKLLDQYFSQLFFLQGSFIDLYLQLENGNSYFFSSYTGESYKYDISQTDWYQQIINSPNKTCIDFAISPKYITYQKPVLRFARAITYETDERNEKQLILRMDFTTDNIDEIIDNYITNNNTSVIYLILVEIFYINVVWKFLFLQTF